MAEEEEIWTFRKVLHSLVVLCVWAIWLPYSWFKALLRLAMELLHTRARWIKRALWMLPGAILLVVIVQFGPLVYGRFALVSEARNQAKTSFGREFSEMNGALRVLAFQYGFKDVIQQEDAFSLESASDTDGEPLCVINIHLEQKVKLLGCFPIVFHIHKKVGSAITPVDFKQKRKEERIILE